MKIVIPGGTGQVGRLFCRALPDHELVVLSRAEALPAAMPSHVRGVVWDGETVGPWAEELEGADAVLNLAGRTVDCRYTDQNLRQMMDSRVRSTRAVGRAIAACERPPRVWLQMSTATVYAHRFDAPNDEETGVLGGWEPGAPVYWNHSIDIAHAWERAQRESLTPGTRQVALRTAMVMSPDAGGVFSVLRRMTWWGLGGAIAGGAQRVSWIHERDWVAAVRFVLAHDEIEGAVNLTSPGPLPQRELMAGLRAALGRRVGLPATAWMAEVGAFVLRTDTELLLKSRYVVPTRLQRAGFRFAYDTWPAAAQELVSRAA